MHTKTKRILQVFEGINNQRIEGPLEVFNNYEPHHVLIDNKLDDFTSLFMSCELQKQTTEQIDSRSLDIISVNV